jgi:putative phosphoesterase
MQIAAIYDIHGNLPALEAVLKEVRQADVDQVVVGGDVVPGPMPRETLTRVLDLDVPAHYIQGNGEVAVLAELAGTDPGSLPEQAREAIRWTAIQLDAKHERLIASWPKTLRLAVAGIGDVLFCHGTPRNENDCFTRLTPEDRLVTLFEGLDVPLVICGHTHMQFDRTIGRIRVVNAGSVGMPFGAPGAYWLLLGPNVELRCTPYDLTKAAERIRATSYPQAEDFAARNVLQRPSEAEMLNAFARVELS